MFKIMRRTKILLFACLAMSFAVPALAQNIYTVAGGGPNNMPAVSANLNGPSVVGLDTSGNLYIAVFEKVFRVDKGNGVLTLYAGGGRSSADDIPGTSAQLCSLGTGIAVDGAGNVFIADECTNRVRRVDATNGMITTYAGNGTLGSSGDGGPATSAELGPYGPLAVDSGGNLFIADGGGGIGKIRRVDATTHVITTVVNAGGTGMAVDSAGNLFLTNEVSELVYRVDATTRGITTVAGNGYQNPYNSYYGGYSGDGGPATSAALNHPTGIAVDGAGNLFIADTLNGRIRRVDAATQVITTVAGNCTTNCSGRGDGGPATSAELAEPTDVVLDGAGNLFIADAGNQKIRRIDASTQVISTFAGNGSCCYSGDGGPATSADGASGSIALDSAGNLFIGHAILVRRVDASTHVISTVAGTENPQSLGDGGPATSAYFNLIADVAIDSTGNLFIVDENQFLVRRVDSATQVITTVAGKTGSNCFPCGGFSGDGGLATFALLDYPDGVTVDTAGNLFISDANNERVRRVDSATQIINTYAGNGYQSYCCGGGYGGDGGPATSAELSGPQGLAVDKAGNLFIADAANHRIRRVDAATGVITTVAGNGYRNPIDPYGSTGGFSGDGGPATSAELNEPTGVAVDSAGNLFIADYGNNRIRRVDAATGVITTVAGVGPSCFGCGGFSGDGGPATLAELAGPFWVAVDGKGNLFISDNNRIREVVASKQAISLAVSSSANPSVFGQAVTLTATVHPSSGTGVPTGTVTFQDGATTLGTSPLNSSGSATLTASSFAVAAHQITATYSGDNGFLGSNASLTENVSYAIRPLYDQTRSVPSGAIFPIKLYLSDASGNDVSSTAVPLHATRITNLSGYSGSMTSPGGANPGGSFRFEAALGPAGGYILNFNTAGLAPAAYSLQFTAGSDPLPHALNFAVR